ncbi:hypothetical protein ACHAW5_009912 [Stephanodiscus triporus]|uniref:Uncharacterized protein n=1 Tax=Stephanodiscus triporus TaxID=2934178 RepID=A0ABD3QLC8_9STRA
MVGPKRPIRLARKSKLKYSGLTSDQEEDDESNIAESDAEGDNDLSGGGGSDHVSDPAPNESSSSIANTRVVTSRRGVTERQNTPSSKTSTSSEKRAHKVNTLPIISGSHFSRAGKSFLSHPSDHGEGENTCEDQKDTVVMRRKRMSSTSNESRESKRSKEEISSDNSISESIDDTTKGGVGSPCQSSKSVCRSEEVVPSTFRTVNVDEVGSKRAASLTYGDARSQISYSEQNTTQQDPEPKSVMDVAQRNILLSSDINYAPHQQKIEGSPSSSSISGDISRDGNRVKPNVSSKFGTTKYTEGSTQEFKVANSTNFHPKRLGDCASNESAEWGSDQASIGSTMKLDGQKIEDFTLTFRSGADNAAKSESLSLTEPEVSSMHTLPFEKKSSVSTNVNGNDGQSSAVSSMQVDWQVHESDDRALVTIIDDAGEQKMAHETNIMTEPEVSFAPEKHEIKTLPCDSESPARTKWPIEYHFGGRRCEVSDSVDTNGVDRNEADQSIHQHHRKTNLNISPVDSDKTAILKSVTTPSNMLYNKQVVDQGCDEKMMSNIVPDETAVHQPTIKMSVEMNCPSSSINEESADISVSMPIQYPKTAWTKETPSVRQLKMALFLETSKAHRDNRPERIFSEYWESLGEYITLGSNKGLKVVRSGLNSSCAGIEAILRSFLKTRKMKRLHNKLVLAIMASALRTDAPARLSNHIPQHWKTKSTKSIADQLNDGDAMEQVDWRDRKSDLRLWRSDFGPQSGTWSACVNEITFAKTDSSNDIDLNLVSSTHSGVLAEQVFLPSARLPGALQIEPLVRKHTSHSGLTASENAIWMLVVAVREHSFALIKKIMSNDKDFGNGYAPRVPNHFQTSIAFPRIPSENSENHEQSVGADNTGKRVINSICLSHVLAENPCAASRLTSMYSFALDDWRGSASHAGLDIVNYLTNLSIQRAARRRQMICQNRQSPARAISKSTLTPPTHNVNVSSNEHSSESSVKAQLHSTQTSSRSLLKSTLAYPSNMNVSPSEHSGESSVKAQPTSLLKSTAANPSASLSESTLTSTTHNMTANSSEHSGESSVKAQLHSTQTSVTSLLKSRLASYPTVRSRSQRDENSVETQLHSTHTYPATWFPLNMPQLVTQRMDHHIPTPLLQSQISLPSMSSQNTQSPYSMQMMNHTTEQHVQPSLKKFIPNPNPAPLADPGFPEIMNTHKKSHLAPIVFTKADQPQNSAIPMNTSYPSSTLPRGSKDLAALLAMPISQPVFAGTKDTISSVENRVDKAALEESDLRQRDRTIAEKTVGNEEKDGVKDAMPIANIPSRPRGRGFGAKNLAALRARTSLSDSARSSFSDAGK